MALKSLAKPRRRLADEAYEQIMQAIFDGSITHDDRIVQEKLADELGISRTPVREALLRMAQEGILTESSRGGFEVRVLQPDEIADLYGSRCAIEGYCAHILAEKNCTKTNNKLRAHIKKAETVKEQTVQAYFNANHNIHRLFVEATGNRYLLEMFDNIWTRGSSYTLFSKLSNIDLSNSLGDHLPLIEAIETGNGSIAAEKMIAHIQDGLDLQISAHM